MHVMVKFFVFWGGKKMMVNFCYKDMIYCIFIYFRLPDCCCQTKATSEGWIWQWWRQWRSGKINLVTSNEVNIMSIWYSMSSFLDFYFSRSFGFPVHQVGGRRGYTLFYMMTWSFPVISCINGIHLEANKLLFWSLKDVVIHHWIHKCSHHLTILFVFCL